MEPKVLADALVEAGIGEKDPSDPKYWPYGIANNDGSDHSWLSADAFITDWRVAGKALESVIEDDDRWLDMCNNELAYIDQTKISLPRAIIEAWYQATEQGEDAAHDCGDLWRGTVP